MTISELKEKIIETGGAELEARLDTILQLAIAEFWYFVDMPGSLWQMYVKHGPQSVVTMPPEVHMLRGVRRTDGVGIELNTPQPWYMEPGVFKGYAWTEVGTTPLLRTIDNAAPLDIELQEAESADLTITAIGPTQVGSRVYDTVTIEAGAVTGTFNKPFVDLIHLSKSAPTNADVLLKDASGNTVARMLNFRKETLCNKYRISSSCSSCDCNSCLDVLYKPHPPTVDQDYATISDPYDTAVLYKAMEIAEVLKDTDLLTLAAKAKGMVESIMRSARTGVTQRLAKAPFVTKGSYANL